MSILNKYKRWKPMLVIDTKNQLDWVLSQDNTPSLPLNGLMNENCLISYIDTNNNECIVGNDLASSTQYTYEKCVNDGAVLSDIVLTGLDNGFINFQDLFNGRTKNEITNKEFYNYLINFKQYPVTIDSGDCRLYLFKVTGNTEQYSYESQLVTDKTGETYYKLLGGFFQGFYKLDGFDYQVLPQYIENTWNLEFVIRPKDYSSDPDYDKEEILNATHSDTDGIFFFMGARAENKFAQFYENDWDSFEKKPCDIEDCHGMGGKYFYKPKQNTISQDELKRRKEAILLFSWLYTPYEYHNGTYQCGCEYASFLTDFSAIEKVKKEYDNSDFVLDGYIEDDMDITDMEITEMSDGKPIDLRNYFEIETDNKYLLFNRTCHGYTTKTFPTNDVTFVLTGTTKELGMNQYLLFNRTCHGYTTQTIDEYDGEDITENGVTVHSTVDNTYHTMKDVINNAFALRVKSDGSIGYRYLMKDCDNEEGWSIQEDYSLPNIVKQDEWNTINVMFTILNGNTDDCGIPYGTRRMKIYIYVNGYLKFISKELPEFKFHALNDTFDKQEGVPFNISLGGGTQGLLESIWVDRNAMFPYILPMEKYFAGSFIGDFRSFKFYNCKMQYNQIKNNYLYEINK